MIKAHYFLHGIVELSNTLITIYKVLWRNTQPIKPGTPGRTPYLFNKVHWALSHALHNTWDQRLYIPSKGRTKLYNIGPISQKILDRSVPVALQSLPHACIYTKMSKSNTVFLIYWLISLLLPNAWSAMTQMYGLIAFTLVIQLGSLYNNCVLYSTMIEAWFINAILGHQKISIRLRLHFQKKILNVKKLNCQ